MARSIDDALFESIFPREAPHKFQREVIEKIIESYSRGKKHVLLSAPTGTGKSIIAMSIAKYLETAYILTSQKSLQDQYVSDFNIPSIKGKYNYFCNKDPRLKCDFGVCSKLTKKSYKCSNCPYYSARNVAYSEPISVMNYSYFFNMANSFPTPQKPRKLLVLDECHTSENELISFTNIKLSKDDFLKFKIGKSFLTFPEISDNTKDKADWLFNDAKDSFQSAYQKEKEIYDTMDESDSDLYRQSRKCKYLDTIVCTINRFQVEHENGVDIVVDQPDKNSISYKVLFGGSFAAKYLFDFAEFSLSMSATIFSKEQFCSDLRLPLDEVVFIQCPSLFSKSIRPVKPLSIADLSYKNKEEAKPKILESVKELLKQHQNERGIIHTINYDLANYLHTNIYDDRIVFPKGKERDEAINYFMHSDSKNLVLLSPSLQEGIDLKDDLARFFIVVKTPYASLGDPWVCARMKADSGWYTNNTIKNIVQMCGRSVRSENDYAVGYILDQNFNYFYKMNKSKFPGWWKEALVFKN